MPPKLHQKQIKRKAFTKEIESDDDHAPELPAMPGGSKNYVTPQG